MNTADTHYVANGVPTCDCRPGEPDQRWQTPDGLSLLLDAGETVMKLSHRLLDEKEKTRFWRYAYLTVSALYVVVLIAAVWGWTR